jgi:hypothetical protein
MKHTDYKALLCLSACGELEGDEFLQLEEHLQSCTECRTELLQMKKVQALTRGAQIGITDAMLSESRNRLHAELVKRQQNVPLGERMWEIITGALVPNYKIAFGGIAMAAFGIMIGYALFSPSRSGDQAAFMRDTSLVRYDNPVAGADQAPAKESMRTENIRIIHADEGDGVVEFVFDAVTPVHVSGKISDKNVQSVLAHALVDEDNPGVRLRAMSVISSQADHASGIDAEVKTALLKALKTDDNPAVRSQAVTALQPFSHDAQIQRALAYALVHDKNSGVRIAAINAIAAASVSGKPIDKAVLNDLKERSQHDNNIFIRNQSRNILEETSQL